MNLLRTQETQDKYAAYMRAGNLEDKCVLCEGEPLQEFEHWKIMRNIFPYDRIAQEHNMIVPKRHATEKELTAAELQEFAKIKEEQLHKSYDFIIEAAHRIKTIPQHFHIHLIVAKG